MLYGLRRGRWDTLVAAGFNVRDLRSVRHPLDPVLLPETEGAEGERALRAQEPVPLGQLSGPLPGRPAAGIYCATVRMKAAVYHGKQQLRVEDVPVPEPGPGEMLVRVDACGICPTDLKKIQKGLLPGPRVFGHEIAGTVAALGRNTTGWRRAARGRAPPRAVRRLLLLRSPALRAVRPLQAQRDHGGFRAVRRRLRRVRARARLDRRARHTGHPAGRAGRGSGVRRAGEHLPQGGAEGTAAAGARRCSSSARDRSACC